MTTTLIAIALLSTFAHWVVIARPQGFGTAQTMFGISQLVMFLGTAVIAAPSDEPYVVFLGFSTTIYMLATVVWATAIGVVPRARRVIPAGLDRPTTGLTLLLVVSIVVTLVYVTLAPQSAFLAGLGGRQTVGEISQLRLDSYATGTYLAPGYVSQFKNVFLPSLAFVWVWYLFRVRARLRWIALSLSLPLGALGLLWNGQRGAFVQFVATACIFLYLLNGRRLPIRALSLALVGLACFGLASLALGRVTSQDVAESGVWAIPKQAVSRIFYENQYSGLMGSRFTSAFEQPMLADWLRQLTGLLPGRSAGAVVDGLIANANQQGGTMPESLIGSALTNLGVVGATAFFMTMALLLGLVTAHGLRGAEVSAVELMGIAGTFSTLGLWAAGTPVVPINNGLFAYAILWFWGARLRRTRRLEIAGATQPPSQYGLIAPATTRQSSDTVALQAAGELLGTASSATKVKQ